MPSAAYTAKHPKERRLLPSMVETEEMMTRTGSSRAGTSPTLLRRRTPLSVVVAGGDDEFRDLVKGHLGAGVRVVGDAATLDEAVMLASRLHPDVVLLDTALSVDGTEVARRIKADHAQTKVVLLTSGDPAASGGSGREGVDDRLIHADALLPKKKVVGDILAERGRPRRGPRKRPRR
jgi:CheY-like chemotaxis protein